MPPAAVVTPPVIQHTEPAHTLWAFITSAGFGGLATLAAALVAGFVAYIGIHRTRVQHRTQNCWDRLTWIIETAFTPDNTEASPLTPDSTSQILEALSNDAKKLKDNTLALAVLAVEYQFLELATAPPLPTAPS